MFRLVRPVLAVLALAMSLSLAATPAQAFAFFQSEQEQPRARQVHKERGFFSFLISLFGKSRGGMDPNGTGGED